MPTFDRVKAISDLAVSWLTLILLLIGGVVAYMQYTKNIEIDKATKSLQFLATYNSEPIYKQRQELAAAMEASEDRVRLIIRMRDNGTGLNEIQKQLDD